MVWYGMVWYGMVWYGMVWYDIVWYGMIMVFIVLSWGKNKYVTLWKRLLRKKHKKFKIGIPEIGTFPV